MKQGTLMVPLAIAVIAGLASCASFEPRPDQQDTEVSITQVDAGLVAPDDGLGEIPGWRMEWVVQAGGADNVDDQGGDFVWAGAVDAGGRPYLAGRTYSTTATFGVDRPSETVLEPYEMGCVFIAKYSPDGDPLWVRTTKTDGYEARGAAVDDEGPVIVGRLQHGPTIFGAGESNETFVELACTDCPFVAQYTHEGAFGWALVPEASEDSRASINDVAVTDDHTICAVGNWSQGAFSFGNGVDLSPSADGDDDGFLLSLDAAGSVRWLRRITGPGWTGFDAVEATSNGGCLAISYYEREATYETNGSDTEKVSGASSYRMEMAHYDRDGSMLWHRDLGLEGENISSLKHPGATSRVGLWVDEDAIAVATTFMGRISVDGEQMETLDGARGGFFGLFDADGTPLRFNAMMPNELLNEQPFPFPFSAVIKAPDGSWITAGTFTGERRLAAGKPEEVLLDAQWHHDGLLAGWTDDGQLLWWRELSGKNEAYNLTQTVAAIASVVRSGEELYVTGGFTGAVRFGARSSDARVLTSWGSFDIFLMKLVPIDNPR